MSLVSMTPFFKTANDDTHDYVGTIFFVNIGINESLLVSMLQFSFPFDLRVGLNCDVYGSDTLFIPHDSYVVLLLNPMCLNEVSIPSFVRDTFVFDPAH